MTRSRVPAERTLPSSTCPTESAREIDARSSPLLPARNVEVRDASQPKAKATPYRLTAIYERTGSAWKLVLVHFSFVKA